MGDGTLGFGIDLRGFQPTPEHLAELVRTVASFRINALFIEWGESFPWHLDQRMRGANYYGEDVVKGIGELARGFSISPVPMLAHGGLPRALLRVPGFSTLAEFDCSERAIEEHGSAAVRLSADLVDDIAAIAGVGDGVALRLPELTGELLERYELRYLSPLIDELRARKSIVWLFGTAEQAELLGRRGGIKRHAEAHSILMLIRAGDGLFHEEDPARPVGWNGDRQGGACVAVPETREGYLGPLNRPVKAQLADVLDRLGLADDSSDLLAESRRLKACFDRVGRALDAADSNARRVEELTVAVSRDSGKRAAARSWFGQVRGELEAPLATLDELQRELRERTESELAEGVLESYFAERVEPCSERLTVALMRLERILR